MWTGRIILESLCHETSAFVTLTYEEKQLPEGNTLSDEHWREFTKGIGYRYFGCGEYGEQYGRPHYHLVLFGCSPEQAELLCAQRWKKGFHVVRPFVFEHAAYTAAYTVKKLNRSDDSRLRPGQLPEFALMSRRPGVGVPGVRSFQSWFRSAPGQRYVAANRDVAHAVRISGAFYPVGRLLVAQLREAAGVPRDDPVRTYRREHAHRLLQSVPELVAAREARRVGQWFRAKHRARRPGAL